jgi:putative ABC transport system permease protein
VDGQPYLSGPSTEQWTGWQSASKSFEAIAGYDWTFDYLILQDGGEAVSGLEVTSDYFKVIGMKPLLGGTFLESETPTNPELATFIILGYDLWQRRFGGNLNIVGQKVRLSRHEPLTVVGVMPPSVRFLPSFGEEMNPNYNVNARVDYWLPVARDLSKPKWGSGNGPWSVAGRLRSDIAPTQAQAELTAIAAKQAHADSYYEGITVRVQRLTEFLNHEGRHLLLPLLGAVALVLLIACGNVAGLLLARGLQRQQEYSVRCALGAPRARLFQQVLTETFLLSTFSGTLGIVLTAATVKAFKAVGGLAIPRLDAVTIGGPVLAVCLVTTILAAVFAGLLPALRASRMDPAEAMKGGNRWRRSQLSHPNADPKSGAGCVCTLFSVLRLYETSYCPNCIRSQITRDHPAARIAGG